MNDSLFNYNIIKLLGEGGMSRVFLAEDPLTHQQVAIKELLPNLAHNKDLRERFRREAQIMAKLDTRISLNCFDTKNLKTVFI